MISIIAPCFNEEDVIRPFYQEVVKVMKSNIEYELIFIDDGSSDNTLQILKHLGKLDPHVRHLSFSRNFGKEAAMLAGINYSSGEAVVIMDADLQHPPSLIPTMIEEYKKGNDQVIAKRNRHGEPWTRSLTAKIYYKLINHFVDITLTDGVGDFRLLSRRAVNSLLSLSEYNRFSKGLFSWIGFKEHYIEYENINRPKGESKWTFFKLLNYGMDGIISFNNRPLRIAIYMGLVITMIDIIYVLFMLVKTFLFGVEVPGYFTIISAILLLGGIQMLFLGIIGEYIGRIYYESKKRPHYIIADNNISQQLKRTQKKEHLINSN